MKIFGGRFPSTTDSSNGILVQDPDDDSGATRRSVDGVVDDSETESFKEESPARIMLPTVVEKILVKEVAESKLFLR